MPVFSFITNLTVFEHYGRLTFDFCSAACKRRVDPSSNNCINPNCPSSTAETTDTVLAFSIAVDLTDHSGTLSGCYLGGQVAEQMLGISVSV